VKSGWAETAIQRDDFAGTIGLVHHQFNKSSRLAAIPRRARFVCAFWQDAEKSVLMI
jgi:hypothetical protein